MNIVDGQIVLEEYDDNRRREFIAGIRELLDWYEDHPNLPAPYGEILRLYAFNKEEFAAYRRASGLHEKDFDGNDYIAFNQTFRGGFGIRIFTERHHVCRQVQVGERVIPAKPACVIEATPESVVPVYEWRCDEPMLSNGRASEETIHA